MSNFKQIQDQIENAKRRVSALLDSEVNFGYKIYVVIPPVNEPRQMYEDDILNKTSYKEMSERSEKNKVFYEKFCHYIDDIASRNDIAVATIHLYKAAAKARKESLGTEQIIFKDAYSKMQDIPIFAPAPAPQPAPTPQQAPAPAPQPAPTVQSQRERESDMNSYERNMMEALGQILTGERGLGEISDRQGSFGAILAVQKKTMENQFEMNNLRKQIDELRKELNETRNYISELERDNEKLERLNEKMSDELDEYRRINPKRDYISGLLGEIGKNIAVGIAKSSKYGALLGFTDDDEPQQIPQTQQEVATTHAPQSSMEVVNDEDDEEDNSHEEPTTPRLIIEGEQQED